MSGSTAEAATITLAEDPDAWAGAGFHVDPDGTCRLGGVRLVLAGRGAGRGVVGWGLRGLADGGGDLDGFPTAATDAGPVEPADHPSTATGLDHLVLLTDDLDRTLVAAARLGLDLRRRTDRTLPDGNPVAQGFFRVGEVILEVVAAAVPPDQPRPGVRPFGLAVVVDDLDRARSVLGEALGDARPAVQPGRRIATVRHRDLGLGTPVALMTPHPRRAPA